MAEAVAFLGAAAAGVQCAQVCVQILMLGLSLRSKLRNTPEQVKRWLGQIEQRVALIELMKNNGADLSLSTLRLLPPLSSSSSSSSQAITAARIAATWVEAALLECTAQAQALNDILKDMLQEVDDTKGQKIWKAILTMKRERRITNSLQEIERQKSMLIMWLGQNNIYQLNDLRHIIKEVQDGTEKIDGKILCIEQTFRQELQGLSTAFHNSSKATASSFESLTNLSTSSVESLRKQMQQDHGELQSKSSIMELQLQSITQEMKGIKHEFRRLAQFRARASRTPSLLKEALQKHSESHTLCLNAGRISSSSRTKRCYSTASQICTCRATSRLGLWSSSLSAYVTMIHRNKHATDCPRHTNTRIHSAAIRCYVQSTILERLVRLTFEATYGAGGLSIGFLLRTYRSVHKHPLESFFRDMYFPERRRHRSSRFSNDAKNRDVLMRLAQRELLHAFNAGIAYPNDVDRKGRTLLHLQVEYANNSAHRTDYFQLAAQIIRLLVSMGAKMDCHDNSGRTPLEALLEWRQRRLVPRPCDYIDCDIIEWTGARPNFVLDGVLMLDCMRIWPESAEDWGYSYICDILLRKSKEDLELFISRGMKPAEETSRRLTPLHLAAAANWPEAVELLLANGANKLAQDSELCLPIDFAIRTQCLQSVALLLSGDCELQFTTRRKRKIENFPLQILYGILWSDESIKDVIFQTLTRLQHSLISLLPYHTLPLWTDFGERSVSAPERFFSAGFTDLELRDSFGLTALMRSCSYGLLQFSSFLLENGANPSTTHRESAITAGFFLAEGAQLGRFENMHLQPCGRLLLQTAFDVSDKVESHCLCSPGGFTPVTALGRPIHFDNKRSSFRTLILCLQWPLHAVEQQARAFAFGEVFNRLEMTHTCVDIRHPDRKISEEDRIAIEIEEDEIHNQLLQLMEEYDLGRKEFIGDPLEYLDQFFKIQELDLPSYTPNVFHSGKSSYDSSLLGPGLHYQSARGSFIGEDIYYGHKEPVTEDNMLALLFDKE